MGPLPYFFLKALTEIDAIDVLSGAYFAHLCSPFLRSNI